LNPFERDHAKFRLLGKRTFSANEIFSESREIRSLIFDLCRTNYTIGIYTNPTDLTLDSVIEKLGLHVGGQNTKEQGCTSHCQRAMLSTDKISTEKSGKAQVGSHCRTPDQVVIDYY
jgi:hypothetical protein